MCWAVEAVLDSYEKKLLCLSLLCENLDSQSSLYKFVLAQLHTLTDGTGKVENCSFKEGNKNVLCHVLHTFYFVESELYFILTDKGAADRYKDKERKDKDRQNKDREKEESHRKEEDRLSDYSDREKDRRKDKYRDDDREKSKKRKYDDR